MESLSKGPCGFCKSQMLSGIIQRFTERIANIYSRVTLMGFQRLAHMAKITRISIAQRVLWLSEEVDKLTIATGTASLPNALLGMSFVP